MAVAHVATQDFRDGASTGAAQLARRLRILSGFGITITDRIIEQLATDIRGVWGGTVFAQDTWVDEGETCRDHH